MLSEVSGTTAGNAAVEAENMSIECLEYAHKNGCPLDDKLCLIAIYENNYECLKYAHENGCLLEEQYILSIKETNNKYVKFINISKIYQQVTKISFIKKLENGSYIVDLSDNKVKKTKKYFGLK